MKKRSKHLPVEEWLLHQRDINPETGCWEWPGSRSTRGYGRIRVSDKHLTVHRVAFEAWVRPLADGECVLHRCDNPPCYNPDHLFPGTLSDNMRDMVSKNRGYAVSGDEHWTRRQPERLQGERNTAARLTENDIRAIRADPRPYRQIAAAYGISPGAVHHILRRRTWKHVA